MTGPRPSRRAVCAMFPGAVVLLAGAPEAAEAHRAKSVLTTVAWNARTHSLEVIHRLHGDDAEAAVSEVMGISPPDLTGIRPQAALALYVSRNFTLARGNGEPLPLDIVGAEPDGADVLVYQEISLDAPPPDLTVADSILLDLFPTQTNTVNVRMGGPVRTAVFKRGHLLETLDFLPK